MQMILKDYVTVENQAPVAVEEIARGVIEDLHEGSREHWEPSNPQRCRSESRGSSLHRCDSGYGSWPPPRRGASRLAFPRGAWEREGNHSAQVVRRYEGSL